MNIQEIVNLAEQEERIYLYGAGKVGREVLLYLTKQNIEITGFLVSKKTDEKLTVNGIEILSIDDKRIFRERSLVIVSMTDSNALELIDSDNLFGFKKVIFLNNRIIGYIKKQNIIGACAEGYTLSGKENKLEAKMLVLKDKNNNKIFRVMEDFGQGSYEVIKEKCTCEQYNEEYGKLNLYKDIKKETIDEKFVVYVATSHLDKLEKDSLKNYEKALQVGCALTEVRKGYICDDSGENISKRNHLYSECTGLYWIWKNEYIAKYVGLEHYRRRLKLDGNPNVDIIVALPQFVCKSIKDFFVPTMMIPRDWELMKEFVSLYDRTYGDVIEKYETNYFYFSCNLCVFKREVFDEFCEFAFSICFKIDEYYESRNIIRNDRYMGYVIENLLSIFILKNYARLKIACTEVEWVEK